MKIRLSKNTRWFLFMLIFSLLLLSPGPQVCADMPALNSSATISMDLQNANLKDILKIFSIQSGLNFIASEAVQDRTVTLYLERVPIQEAMNKLFKANNLSYEIDPDSNIILVKDWGKAEIETITKVFPLRYQSVPGAQILSEVKSKLLGADTLIDIIAAIKGVVSSSGKIDQDPRTNSLIITDMPSRFLAIEQVLMKLDVPVPSVLIEVEMLDVSRNAVDKIGFKWGQTPMTLILTGATRQTIFPFKAWTSADSRPPTTNVGGLSSLGSLAFNDSNHTYSLILDFLKTQTDTRYLARPRILTLNNETAEIKITTQESVGVKTTTQGTTTTQTEPERMETGVSLRVTPQVNTETGEITMFINPEVSEATAGNTITAGTSGSFTYRDPEVRSTKTTVRVKDGETIIVGGLIRNEKTEVITKLPIFGDLPLIGGLFRHKDKSKDKERELLIFITPRIVMGSGATALAQLKEIPVTLPEREQSDHSVGDRIAIIDASLSKFERKR